MQQALTLTVPPAVCRLDGHAISHVQTALADHGAALGQTRWLAPDIAADIPFEGMAPEQAEKAARSALSGMPCDLLAQPQQDRRKRLLIADMDSTIVGIETLDELADFARVRDKVAAITERSMRGEVDFVQALEERVAMLAGLPEAALAEAYKRVFFLPGARTLVSTMRAHGAFTALVSGGFRFFTERVRQSIGFDYDEANALEVVDGRLTGRIVPPIINRDGKLRALQRLAEAHQIPLAETLAIGDGANDLAMIRAAGLGVAYHGKAVVASQARAKVEHGDLTTVLYFQGYRREEFGV